MHMEACPPDTPTQQQPPLTLTYRLFASSAWATTGSDDDGLFSSLGRFIAVKDTPGRTDLEGGVGAGFSE